LGGFLLPPTKKPKRGTKPETWNWPRPGPADRIHRQTQLDTQSDTHRTTRLRRIFTNPQSDRFPPVSAEAFFNLHRDLPRQGPGEAADVVWAGQQMALPEGAAIADLACGPGADIGPLLGLVKDARLTAIDRQPHFIEEADAQWGRDARVDLRCGDMAEPGGPYDLIWCAGAAYILGVSEALLAWRAALAPGGHVVFSEPCFWDAQPTAELRGIWAEYPAMSDAAGIDARVRAAGYETLATRRLSADAWEDYYRPLEARINGLRDDADPALAQILAGTSNEIAAWRQYGDQFGYLLSVVRPV